MDEKKQKSLEHSKNVSMPEKLYRTSFIFFYFVFRDIHIHLLFWVLKYIFIVDIFNIIDRLIVRAEYSPGS